MKTILRLVYTVIGCSLLTFAATVASAAKPTAPSGLAATATSTNTIRLTWTDNASNETGFKIERKTGAGGTYAQITTVGSNVTTYTNSGLTAATTYYFRVRAYNGSGNSAYCAEVNATTFSDSSLPSPWLHQDIGSVGLAGSATYSSPTFTISGSGADIWDAADAFHFVYRPWTNDVEIIARVVTQQNSDSWAKAGVMVRESLAVDSKHAMTVLTPGFGASFQRRTTTGGGSMEDDSGGGIVAPYWVKLVRSGNTLTGYQSSNGSTWVQVGSDTVSMSGTVYVGLPVTAHNNTVLNTSTFDNVTVRVPTILPPAAPSGLAATAISSSQIDLSWADNADNESGFDIERKTGAGGTYAYIGSTSVNVTTAGDSGLVSNTTYFYRVRAYNAGGYSDYCSEVSTTTLSSSYGTGLYGEYYNNVNLTGAPTLLRTDATVNFNWGSSAPDASLPSDNFSVRWTGRVQPQYSQTYIFYTMSDDGVRLWVNGVQLVNNWTGHSATEDSGTIALTAGQQYTIQMEFFDSGGDAVAQLSWSSPSTPKAIIPQARLYLPPPPPAPSAPSGLSADATSGTRINLTWTDNANNEMGFKIERKTGSGGTYAQIATVGANTTSYSNTGLTPETQYYYRVRAFNLGGDSAYCTEANATTEDAGSFENPGVYSQIVNDMRYEWIGTRDVSFEITSNGRVKIIAPTTKTSFNGANSCNRFIYDHTHTRLSASDASALFGSGLMLPAGNYGFALLWLNSTSYDDVYNRGWDLTANPDTYQGNSAKVDYIHLSIVPVTPITPPASSIPEVAIPDGLKRVSWLSHYLLLPYNLNLPADRGFGVTRILMDVPLNEVYQKVTQISYMYSFLDNVANSNKWRVLRAYPGDTVMSLIQNAIVDTKFGYMSQMDEDFGSTMGDPDHLLHAQQVLQGIYNRLVNEKGVTSPNQTRLYDDYFSDMGGYSNSENFRWNFNANNLVSFLASQATARQNNGGSQMCAYFSQNAYAYRNWFQGAYLDSYERIPEGMRIYNEIYNFEKKFMAAPDRKVCKFGWIYAEGINSTLYRHGNDARLHFPTGDIIRPDFVSWPYQMMLNESFWTLLLGHDLYLWNSSVPMVTDINTFGDSWYGGQQTTLWQPTGGSIVNYDPNNPAHPQRTSSPLGQFPEAPQLGESGAFAGAWLVSQLTTVSDRTSTTIEYCPFTYQINGGATQNGYYNGSNPFNGTLGNAKLSRYGVANYGQANIVRSYEARKPICIYTQGASRHLP